MFAVKSFVFDEITMGEPFDGLKLILLMISNID